jgi:hypothetical protein
VRETIKQGGQKLTGEARVNGLAQQNKSKNNAWNRNVPGIICEAALKTGKGQMVQKQYAFILKIVLKIINKLYWERAFKKNGVTYESSFAKPYGD